MLLEKPFTTDVAEAHELCAAAKVADDGRSSGSGRRLLLVRLYLLTQLPSKFSLSIYVSFLCA